MKRVMGIKILVDVGMTVALLFLMSYELMGQKARNPWCCLC